MLATIDWIVILGFLALIVGIGISYTRYGSKNLETFFLGGRNLPWYIAGISMVATTFAADTPLAVTELVGQSGIAGNWLWWSFLAGGLLTTFFFAKLWRKSGVLTEVELIELRYNGKPAQFLRGFKAIYLGLILNMVIIAWVNVALISLLEVFFGIPKTDALYYTGGTMLMVALYSSLAGLMGIVITDVIQFVVAMTGTIILSVLVINSPEIGGIAGLKAGLPEGSLNFFPSFGAGGEEPVEGIKTLGLSVGAFLAYSTVQWWASWYPGAEPGGGGYVAQRMMSARSEKDAVYATLFFNFAHYCLRPWPWILVGLAAIILYPELTDENVRLGYVYAMKDFLPAGLKGLLLVAFFAAYMSTISTQLNWGASYLVNDLYYRFLDRKASDKRLIAASRIATLILMVFGLAVTTQVTSISGAWGFIMEAGAGLGLVLILRWYWWRINAWAEIAATVAPFIAMAAFYSMGIKFPDSFFGTVLFTTIVWITVMYLTPPTDQKTLQHFFNKVKPDGAWNNMTFTDGSEDAATQPTISSKNNLLNLAVCWISSIVLIYGMLILIGKIIFGEWPTVGLVTLIVLVSFLILRHFIGKTRIFTD